MTNFTFVPTHLDWTEIEEFHGWIPGLYCGYNFEVRDREGRVDFMSCTFYPGTPEEYATDEFNVWRHEHSGLTLTGRVLFRGYYEEDWDIECGECYTKVDRPFGDYAPLPGD